MLACSFSSHYSMDTSLVLLGICCFPAILCGDPTASNITNSTNDMYVIHATVYQVGIITNKSDDEIANMTGNQEALSFYHSNGSNVDLSAIPAPLITNVTANSAVAVAPVQLRGSPNKSAAMTVLDQLTSGSKPAVVKRSENSVQPGHEKSFDGAERSDMGRTVYMKLFRRSTDNSSAGPTIKVVKETSLIPPEVGLKSIGLPDLVGLNTSLASVPVPIPNTSVVRYAKVNTVVKAT